MSEAVQAGERAEIIRLIRDSAAAVAPPGGELKRIRALRFTEPGFDRQVWAQMCEMGWLGLRVAEADGGAGLGMGEFCALAEALGAGLAPEPLVTAALAARLLRGPALQAALAGETLVLPAWQERANSLDAIGTTRFSNGRVTGRKLFVPFGAAADAFLVTTADGLALVRRDAPGVAVLGEGTQDGGSVATIGFDDAPGEAVAGGAEDVAAALDEAALATAASLLGVMERAFALTLDYLRTRQQFGRTIGGFQVLQHRAVDLRVQMALARASIEAAAVSWDEGGPLALRQGAVSRAKARAADAANLVTRQAVQLHGGIGYTEEADIGLFLRRAMVLANQFGTSGLHRARFAACVPDEDD